MEPWSWLAFVLGFVAGSLGLLVVYALLLPEDPRDPG
jgi:hypothetical protein